MEVLEKYRKYVDLAELRVDFLDPDERFLIRRFPEMAGLPVILTIRRESEGGHFLGGEGSRIALFARGLAYAVPDKRRNFAYVDLEEDLDVPSLEEAARAFGTRIIRSWHNMEGIDEDLAGKLRKLRRDGDELVKVAVNPKCLDDVVKVYKAAKKTTDIEKILLCIGEYSANTRILAEVLGSRISFASPLSEPDMTPAGLGQLDAKDMAELYRFRKITPQTKIFGVAGYPLKVTDSPYFFNTAFREEHIDAVYVPIPTDSVHSLIRLAEEIGILGLSITIPYKEEILPYLSFKSKEVVSIGACNTIVADSNGWVGYNTDVTGFSGSLLSYIGRKDFRGRKITIIGAGGSAKAIASEICRLKGKALILNRTTTRARSLAEPYRFAWGGLDGRGAELMERYSDIIIQATPVGMMPNPDADPLEFYKFSGRETVMDLIYKPEKTLCLQRAEKAGCRILNGSDMLHRQAREQYFYYMKKEFPTSLISRAGL
jgi:3-dehydroquinate dehydratase/shikimate dehydrogenase